MRSSSKEASARESRLRSRARGRSPVTGALRSGGALALLVGVAAIPLVLSSLGTFETPELSASPPYPVPSVEGIDRSGDRWQAAGDLEAAGALVYVSEQCPHCRSELAHWAALSAADEEIPLRIVASPTSEFEGLDWVPQVLRERVVSDAEGAIAKALGVRSVPVTLWIDSGGVVRDQRMGASSARQIQDEYRSLVASPAPKRSPPQPSTDHPFPGGPS